VIHDEKIRMTAFFFLYKSATTISRIFLIGFLITIVSSCGGSDDEQDPDMLGEWTGAYTLFNSDNQSHNRKFEIKITAVDKNKFSGVWKYDFQKDWPPEFVVEGFFSTVSRARRINIRLYSKEMESCSSVHGNYITSVEEYDFVAPITNSDNFFNSPRTDFSSGCFGGHSGGMTISRTSGGGGREQLPIITKNENNATFTVTEGSLGNIEFELHITGSGNTITIAKNQNIRHLRFIGGSNNLVTFPPITPFTGQVFLLTITSTGSDNTIFLPNGSFPLFTVELGNGDQIIFYD